MSAVFIISGANNGIGLESVKQFLSLGMIVVAISRNINNLELINQANLVVFQCDITDYARLQPIIHEVEAAYKRIDCLINNAGVSYSGDYLEISHAKNMNMIDINTKGITNMLELVLPIMRKNMTGTIMNISSLSDRHPRPTVAVYAATKAYIRSLSESLRLQNAAYNIRITNVAPAPINTALFAGLKVNVASIKVEDFVSTLKFIYQLPQYICIRDFVIAPTEYLG